MTAPNAEDVIADELRYIAGNAKRASEIANVILAALRTVAPDGEGEAVVLVERPGAPVVRWPDPAFVRSVLAMARDYLAGWDDPNDPDDGVQQLIADIDRLLAESAPDRTVLVDTNEDEKVVAQLVELGHDESAARDAIRIAQNTYRTVPPGGTT